MKEDVLVMVSFPPPDFVTVDWPRRPSCHRVASMVCVVVRRGDGGAVEGDDGGVFHESIGIEVG